MSNDKDFFRYKPEVPGIICDYEINKKGKIKLIYKEKPDNERWMPSKRELLWPPPLTLAKLSGYARILIRGENTKIYGNPTALIKFTGNPHAALQPLRKALMAFFGI